MTGTGKTIVVAMSGGVDSSVVAAMLCKEGHNVIGITLQLYDHGAALQKKGACCAGQDIYDAKRVADKLGFAHYVFDYESKFKQEVIDDFADSYIRGETPLPCVKCNQSVKFHDLLKAAKELKADALATGHYAQKIINNNNAAELHKGVSIEKDQSYFLFATTKEQLDYLMFPLGGKTKQQTRDLAREFGLEIADKPDSRDICFVPNGNYREIIDKLRPAANKPGKLVHIDGYDLGMHKGIASYTIGQRRGLGIALKEAVYVIKIDPETNTVYVGPESALVKSRFLLKDFNKLTDELLWNDMEVTAKIRSTARGVRARLKLTQAGQIEVHLLEEEKAVSPGQACVFYQGTRMLGGGWITREVD